MKTFKITQNGILVKSGLTEHEAIDNLFIVVEDYSNGYIYDNEDETIYNEVDGSIIANKGDMYVMAGDDFFEIKEEEEDDDNNDDEFLNFYKKDLILKINSNGELVEYNEKLNRFELTTRSWSWSDIAPEYLDESKKNYERNNK
ncbi:hypothetical protein CMU94_02180 [Elizabethkingia anophelis]|nr:hypothetical protein [Elizabethkingia anophelis]